MEEHDPKRLIEIARANGDQEDGQPLDLGLRVRQLRKARDWTLEQAAAEAGLARSTLSKIENGQMSPTYDALKKLATGLAISIPQLFTPPQDAKVNGRLCVTKFGEGTAQARFSVSDERFEVLQNDFHRNANSPFYLVRPSRRKSRYTETEDFL